MNTANQEIQKKLQIRQKLNFTLDLEKCQIFWSDF